MQKILISLAVLSLMLGGCAHKIEIQQGNVVTQAQLAGLHTGMDSREVRSLLGTPMLTDPFHPDRWDYFYSMRQDDEVLERYKLTLYFSGDQLSRIEKKGSFPVEEYQKPRED